MGWMSAQVGEIREDFPFIGLLTLEFSHTMSPAFRESCSKSGAHSLGGAMPSISEHSIVRVLFPEMLKVSTIFRPFPSSS